MAEVVPHRGRGRPPKADGGDAVLNIKGLPEEVAERFRGIAASEGATQGETLDALTAMYEAGERRDALEADVAALEARLQAARAELRQAESEREQAEAHAGNLRRAATEEAQRQLGLSRAAVDLLMSLVEMGATRDAVLRWGQALQAAQVEPEQAARMMEKVGGLVRLGEQLETGCTQAETMRDRLMQELSAARQAKTIVERQTARMEQAIGEVGRDLEDARAQVLRWQSNAREFGLYLEFVQAAGGRVEAWPLQVARTIAGAILFAAVQAHGQEGPDGNPELVIGPNMTLQRVFPARLRLSEVPALLAPPSAYAAMLRATQEREALAATYAGAPVQAAEGGEG